MQLKLSSCRGCSLYEPPIGKSNGFIQASGTGKSGVFIVGEAGGEHEEEAGVPFVGKAGHYLFQQLKRVGIEREDFTLFNCIACRPPLNKLAKQPYEAAAIEHCAPNLDLAISNARLVATANHKTFTILTLGRIAFKRIMGLSDKSPIMHKDYLCYPFWSERYQAFVVGADHPSYLMRGNHHLAPILQFAATRALEIASNGLVLDTHQYLLDPPAATFSTWVEDYLRVLDHDPLNTYLSYDIETPHKQGKDEEEVAREDDDDYTILRCSFSYRPNEAVSVPWTAAYMPMLEELFGSSGDKVGWNNNGYDDVRIMVQMPINGSRIDAMLAWHVLNTSLPKGLGFVTPFYAQTMSAWKYMSEGEPAFYNAKDADAALRDWLGIKKDLIANKLWDVFNRHVIELNKVFNYMSKQGVLLDQVMRADAEAKLTTLLEGVEQKMEAAVPVEVLRSNPKDGYKKEPKSVEGMVQRQFSVSLLSCPSCGAEGVTKAHTKAKKKGNPCQDVTLKAEVKQVTRWCKVVPFKVSKLGLMSYQKSLSHQAIINRKENKITFDENAITRLIKKYPSDPLYPIILEHRGHQKLLSTYIGTTNADGTIRGGMPIGRDGRIHTLFTSNPSTLRSASQNPNLQNLPRPRGDEDLASIIRNLVVARPGSILSARDYCVSPQSKILKADLTWTSAIDLKVGDELIGFDESLEKQLGIGKGRSVSTKYRSSKVTAIRVINRPRVQVTTTKGSTIVSSEHRFVARYKSYKRKWVEAENLKPGMVMPFLASPWNVDESRDAGYLAGFLDGEGYVGKSSVGFGQNSGITLDKVLSILQEKGFHIKQHGRPQIYKTNKQFKYAVVSGIGHQLWLLGSIRPIRLLSKSRQVWEGKQTWGKIKSLAEVISINNLPSDEVVAIETTTGTFISDGFFSHNCGIEAVLVGYFALSPRYIRLAKMDVHSFYTAYGLHQLDGRISANDLPDHTWDDERLIPHLAAIKKEFKLDRNNLYKHLVHGANFMQGAKGAAEKIYSETGIEYPVGQVGKVMGVYFELFPEIRKWHKSVLLQADRDGFLRNPFGYVHRFSKIYENEKIGGEWIKSPGPQANQAIAFLPQSTAAGIIKEAMLRLFNNRFEEAGQFLRLLVHDELFFEVLVALLDSVDMVVKEEMERPIDALPLPKSYGMGDKLVILTEAKQGLRWGGMH